MIIVYYSSIIWKVHFLNRYSNTWLNNKPMSFYIQKLIHYKIGNQMDVMKCNLVQPDSTNSEQWGFRRTRNRTRFWDDVFTAPLVSWQRSSLNSGPEFRPSFEYWTTIWFVHCGSSLITALFRCWKAHIGKSCVRKLNC